MSPFFDLDSHSSGTEITSTFNSSAKVEATMNKQEISKNFILNEEEEATKDMNAENARLLMTTHRQVAGMKHMKGKTDNVLIQNSASSIEPRRCA